VKFRRTAELISPGPLIAYPANPVNPVKKFFSLSG